MNFRMKIEQEADGRWITEVVDLPGGLAYRSSSEEAQAKVQALALRVLADRLDEPLTGDRFDSVADLQTFFFHQQQVFRIEPFFQRLDVTPALT